MDAKVTTNKNFIYNLLYEVIIVLTPLIITPYVSRVLGAELIGARSYTFAILSYFELFANLGIAIYGQREIAKIKNDREKRSRVFLSLFALKSVSFLLVLLGYCAVFFAFGVLSKYKVLFLLWIIHLFESFFNVTWYFQGVEKFKHISLRGIVIRIIQIIATLIFVKTTDDFYIYILLYALFPLLQAVSLWPFLIKDIEWKQIKNVSLRIHLKDVLVFFIPTVATVIYSNVDKIMLGSMLENTIQVGYYESAQHIVLLCTTVFTSLFVVMRSRISAQMTENNECATSIRETIIYFVKVCSLVVFPVSFGLLAISDNFVIVFFGEEFEPVINMLRLFIPIVLILGLSGFISSIYIVPFDKQKYLAFFYIIATLLNVVLNFILIPVIFSYGAIISSIVAEFVVLLGCVFLSRKHFSIVDFLKCGWKYILSSLIMFASVFGIKFVLCYGLWQLVVEIVIGVLVYGLALLILRDDFISPI